MSDDKIAETSTGAVLVALGKLEARQEEAQRQHQRCAEQNEQQIKMLGEIREELRVKNTQLEAMIRAHDVRLNAIEPIVTNLQSAFQQNLGMRKLAATAMATIGGAAALLLQSLSKKLLGWP